MKSAAAELVRELASSPRFAGSPSETSARERCAGILRDSGFNVSEESFEFSEFPARAAPPLMALILGGAAIGMGALAAADHHSLALVLGISVATALSVAGRILSRDGVLNFPLMLSSSTNLVAQRGGMEVPRVWLVAHLDSKSQTIPMLLRIGSAAMSAVLFTLTIIVILAQGIVGASPARAALMLGVSTAVTLLPIMLCFVGNRSNGALDNASGVVTILAAADSLAGRKIGVVITSGEELGLAGARAFVRSRAETGVAINCDTIDDSGRFLFMRSGRSAESIENAIDRAADRMGLPTRGSGGRHLSPMLPGVLADNIAFTDAGWESFTLSRGNLGTLSRVHTHRDRADSMDGTGIAQAAALIAAIVEELS